MKSILLAALVMLTACKAFADNYVCRSEFQGMQIQLNSKTAEVLIVSDSYISRGRKVIAKFSNGIGTALSSEAGYEVFIDLRDKDLGRRNEHVGPAKLGALKYITVEVDTRTPHYGEVTFVERTGDSFSFDLDCEPIL